MHEFARIGRPTGDDPISPLFDAIATAIMARNPEIGEEEFYAEITAGINKIYHTGGLLALAGAIAEAELISKQE